MDLSSPRALCHLSTPTHRWVRGIAETISFSRATRWGGRSIVMFTDSELLTVPCGFVQLTRESTMSFGKGMRHTMGCAPVGLGEGRVELGCGGNVLGVAVGPGSTTAPHIYPEASW